MARSEVYPEGRGGAATANAADPRRDVLSDALREALASCASLREEIERLRDVATDRNRNIRIYEEEIEMLKAQIETTEGYHSRLAKLVDEFLAAEAGVVNAKRARQAALEALDNEGVPF